MRLVYRFPYFSYTYIGDGHLLRVEIKYLNFGKTKKKKKKERKYVAGTRSGTYTHLPSANIIPVVVNILQYFYYAFTHHLFMIFLPVSLSLLAPTSFSPPFSLAFIKSRETGKREGKFTRNINPRPVSSGVCASSLQDQRVLGAFYFTTARCAGFFLFFSNTEMIHAR